MFATFDILEIKINTSWVGLTKMVCSTSKTSNSLLTFFVELTTSFHCIMQGVICTDPKGLLDKTFGELCDANENKNTPWILAKTIVGLRDYDFAWRCPRDQKL